MIEALALVSVFVAAPHALPQDPDRDLRRDARAAAFRYESLLRRRAPVSYRGGGSRCDEVIGRFCFLFTDDGMTPADTAPAHPDIVTARGRAIQTHRAWLSTEPARAEAAGALIRYLIDADRASEAVAVARTHAWAAERSPESLLLLGLAHHEAGSFDAAESAFDSARAMLGPAERRRLDDVGVLLEAAEERRYRELSPEERERYEGRFWRFSDPSLLEAGNERRSAHYARQAWVRILAEAPGAAGRTSWGRDSEEIVLRYGLPTRRERMEEPAWRLRSELSVVEVFDPHGVSFVPSALLTEGLAPAPAPGEEPSLERDTVRSSYTPVRLHRTRGLSLQVARFPIGRGAALVVSGALPSDTAWPPPVSPEGLVVVLDTLGGEVARAPAAVRVARDSVVLVTGEVAVGPGSWVYRVEVRDDSTRQAGLAQYRIEVEPPGQPALSDLLLAVATPEVPPSRAGLTPTPAPVIPTDGRVLIWAEASGLTRRSGEARYAVEWWVESADPGSVLGRAVRWVGRQVGLLKAAEPVRVRWEDRSRETPAPIAFAVDLAGLEAGLYRIGVTVRDAVTGRTAAATRLVRLDPAATLPDPRARD